MSDSRCQAEVKVGGEHLHLFAEHNALGVQASVYNVNAKNWIAPSEPVDDIQQGKARPMHVRKPISTRRQQRIASFGMEEILVDIKQPSRDNGHRRLIPLLPIVNRAGHWCAYWCGRGWALASLARASTDIQHLPALTTLCQN
jgi:hypothetical protein